MSARNILLVSLLVLFVSSIQAQNYDSALKFDSYEFDFGTIREADGVVRHTFVFNNISSSAVVIEHVAAECGCTTPVYNSEPIRPGGEGSVVVEFNPKNFKGEVTKSVSVFSNKGKSRNDLKIKANVIERPRSIEERFPFTLGDGLRANKMYVEFGYLKNKSVNSMAVEIFNQSDDKIEIRGEVVPNGKNINVNTPKKLDPRESGFITITYEFGRREVYGLINDKIYIYVNDRRAKLPISASALVVDDFDKIDTSKAPVCVIEPEFHHFGKVGVGIIRKKEFTITNRGKKPLIVRSIFTRSNSETDLKEGTKIAPGNSVTFNVSMIVTQGLGVKSGGVIITTNDPVNTLKEVRVVAQIDQ